jgi:hypothetical protein
VDAEELLAAAPGAGGGVGVVRRVLCLPGAVGAAVLRPKQTGRQVVEKIGHCRHLYPRPRRSNKEMLTASELLMPLGRLLDMEVRHEG